MTDVSLNYPQAEAALCIWEWLCDRHRMADATTGPAHDMLMLWEDVGSAEMRNLAIRLATPAEAFYTVLCNELGEDYVRHVFTAYDWEFIPHLCMGLDWAGDLRTACYMPSALTLPPTMAAHFKSALWHAEARTAAARIWGYAGLLDDDPDGARAAFERGDDPTGYVYATGSELGLAEPDPYTAATLAKQHPPFPVNRGNLAR